MDPPVTGTTAIAGGTGIALCRRCVLRYYVAGAALIVAAVVAVQFWPDLERYRRIRNM